MTSAKTLMTKMTPMTKMTIVTTMTTITTMTTMTTTQYKINLTFQCQNPSNFKVVKKVVNTQGYQYLWLTM